MSENYQKKIPKKSVRYPEQSKPVSPIKDFPKDRNLVNTNSGNNMGGRRYSMENINQQEKLEQHIPQKSPLHRKKVSQIVNF